MRARNLFAAGLMTALSAACSQPAGQPDPRAADDEALGPRELALVTDPRWEVPLVSAIELPQTAKPEVARAERTTRAAQPAVAKADAAPADEHAHPPEPAPTLSAISVPHLGPVATARPMPRAVEPGVAVADGDPSHVDPMSDRGRRGGVIIIRGGRGSGIDPCAIHIPRPVAGGAGALINDRAPRPNFPTSFPRGGLR